MNLIFFNAKPYYDTDTIRETMMEALPAKNEEVLDRILQRYYEDENMHLMGVLDEDENMLGIIGLKLDCLLYTSPSPRDRTSSSMPSSA